MKKTLIILGVASTFSAAAHAQSSVTLYGSLDAGLLYVNNWEGHSNWLEHSSTLSNTYFGLKGVEDLGGGTKAIFRLESGFDLTNGGFAGNGLFNRQAYVGLQNNQYGTLTLGRQYDSVVDYLSPLALAGQAGGVNVAAHPLNNDNIGAQYSVANSVKYESANHSGFHFGALYGFSNQAGGFANGRAWSVGAGYSNGPLTVAAAYDQSNINPNAAVANPSPAVAVLQDANLQRTFGVGANYAFGPGTVGLLWTHTILNGATFAPQDGVPALNAHFDNIELNGTYGLTPALALVGEYTYTFGKTSGAGTQSSSPRWHSVTLGTDYSLSKRTDLYFAGVYQHASGDLYNDGQGFVVDNSTSIANALPPSSTPNQVGVTAGIRHRF
ncbi:porin [Paraburkholderia sp. J11-2]|uniref:porin n=1 Tax=Paraburkholderia sp. J11-2 TaxID=2805431 RepID=UPI002AB7C466|nr:porin [Paraburkholderia sp. J11-2]